MLEGKNPVETKPCYGREGGGGGVDKIFRTKRKRKKKLLLLGLPNNALNLRLAFHQ